MGQDCLGTTGDHCCHAMALRGEPTVAHGIHTAVDPMESPGIHPPIYDRWMKAEFDELPQRDHPVLFRCHLGDFPIHPLTALPTGRFPDI